MFCEFSIFVKLPIDKIIIVLYYMSIGRTKRHTHGDADMMYTAKAAPGSSAHTKNVPDFDTVEQGVNYYAQRGWRVAEWTEDGATMELWLDHSSDPMLALDKCPDKIVYIGPKTAAFLNPFHF